MSKEERVLKDTLEFLEILEQYKDIGIVSEYTEELKQYLEYPDKKVAKRCIEITLYRFILELLGEIPTIEISNLENDDKYLCLRRDLRGRIREVNIKNCDTNTLNILEIIYRIYSSHSKEVSEYIMSKINKLKEELCNL
jgi:hypothetical protein